jgi:hypothetical protein
MKQKSTTDTQQPSTALAMLAREDFASMLQEAMLGGRAHWVVDVLVPALAQDQRLWPAWGASLVEAFVLCGERSKALVSVARWQALYPFDVLASLTRAELLSHAGLHAKAIEVLQAIPLHHVSAELMPEVLLIRGQIARRHRDFDQAHRAFAVAYERFSEPRAALAIGELCMVQADYPRGFQWLSMQRALPGRFGNPPIADHVLDRLLAGTLPARQSIWVLFHHGLGDCLQLMRFVEPLIEQGFSLLCHVPALLCAALQERFPNILCLAREHEPMPHGQAWLSSWDLPLLGPMDWFELPGPLRFAAQPNSPQMLLDRVNPHHGQQSAGGHDEPAHSEQMPLRIGLCWRGQSHSLADRSVPFELMGNLLAMPSVRWVCLQADLTIEEFDRWTAIGGCEPEQFKADQDFEGLLQVVRQLDIVITIDTFVAHLAGCEGKPILCLLPAVEFWPWSRQFDPQHSVWQRLQGHLYRDMPGDPTPWYPGMSLLRQSVLGHWDEEFKEVERFVAAAVARQSAVVF